jgi:hypothetical protein
MAPHSGSPAYPSRLRATASRDRTDTEPQVFQCLAHTVEWESDRWRRLDDIHRFRNRFDYGDIIDVSEDQVETTIADAQALLDAVVKTFPRTKP